jgi:hypothetical protein
MYVFIKNEPVTVLLTRGPSTQDQQHAEQAAL